MPISSAMNYMKYCMIACIILLGVAKATAQDQVTLRLGDPAPELKYSKWIKGTPVKNLNDGNMYVVEFWATWCGPCIGAMPHLSELAEKYKNKVTFIGADIWEKTGDQPYSTSLPKVVRFVEGNTKNMRYNVIADTDDQYNFNNWVKAAGIKGIPSTFLIYKGKIVWIGHPLKLDEVIDPILDGSFDFKKFKESYEKSFLEQSNAEMEQRKKFKALIDARESKNFKRVVAVVDSMSAVSPELKERLLSSKFNALLNYDQPAALALAEEIVRKNPDAGPDFGLSISSQDGLSKELYQFGANALKDIPMSSFVASTLGTLYSKASDYKSAVSIQQKAVDLAKAELKDPRFSGRTLDYMVKDYEEKLMEYKSKL